MSSTNVLTAASRAYEKLFKKWVPLRNESNWVTVKDAKSRTFLSPSEQTVDSQKNLQFSFVDPEQPGAPSAFAAGSTIKFRLKPSDRMVIRDVMAYWVITIASAAATLVPISHWATQYEFRGNGGNTHLQTLFPEPMLAEPGLLYNQETQAYVFKRAGQTNASTAPVSTAAGTYDYIFPLFGNFIKGIPEGLWDAKLAEQIELTLTLPATIVQTGSGTVTISKCQLMLIEEPMLPDEEAIMKRRYAKTQKLFYLDTIKWSPGVQTFSAGVETRIQMQPIRGQIAYMMLLFRSSTAYAANAMLSASSIGSYLNGAWFDVLDANQVSIFTKNQHWMPDMFNSVIAARQYPGVFLQTSPYSNWYIIPFSDFAPAVEQMRRIGTYLSLGQDYLSIKPDSATTLSNVNLDVYVRVFRILIIPSISAVQQNSATLIVEDFDASNAL
jgi:hypothetical protein